MTVSEKPAKVPEPYSLASALATRYPPAEYATFFEVRNGTGYARKTVRSADAMVVSLWPSRGLEIHGFESKISRGDWKRELDEPAKAEEHFKRCDRWWLITSDMKLAKLEEIPVAWGWLAWDGFKLKTMREAPLNPSVQPFDRLALAALARSADEGRVSGARALADSLRADDLKKWEANAKHRHAPDLYAATEGLRLLRETVAKFEAASGVTIGNHWDAAHVGAAVKLVLSGDLGDFERNLAHRTQQAKTTLDVLVDLTAKTQAALDEYRAATKETPDGP